MCNDHLVTASEMHNSQDENYPEFLESIKNHFNSIVNNDGVLFTTDSEGLFEVFLDNLPPEYRQFYTCHSCRHFVNRFGGLVTIKDNGEAVSALWTDVPDFFSKSISAMNKMVLKSKVNGVFLSSIKILGEPVTGKWHHMAIDLPAKYVYKSRLLTAGQKMAEKLEDFKILMSGLSEYPASAVDQAVTLLKTESLYRSEKTLGVAEWLQELHAKLANVKNNRLRENIVWLAVATAPVGYCHVKSTMIGTLLDDIIEGLPFDVVSRKFADKMHPLQYQRPQADPTEGNIAQAEKIVEKLGIQKSLVRRFAKIEEINCFWSPKEEKEAAESNGVFSHLLANGNKKETVEMSIPTVKMTWRKFSETVLPLAESIEYLVKNARDGYSAILTASYDDAPPILQWDKEERRNPFSWYVYNMGSSPTDWNLSTGYCQVTGVCYQPSMWYEDNSHQGKALFFILKGAKDTRYKGTGCALFPETLKSELREIRSTIEAYSKSAILEGYDEASACGIRLQYGSEWNANFRVKSKIGTVVYSLDRWD
jgi:hypothetical protein